LGTMATQNANAVVITGGNATLTTITANNHVATANITTTANLGSYSYGTLGYSDINIFASYAANLTSYAQVVLQNANNGATASVDFVVSNDQGSSSANYGDFGINSSGFSGTGNFNKAGAVYLYAASTDISIGTWSANAIHFIAGGNTNADAMTVNANNTVTIATLAQSTSSTATFATSSLPLVPAGYIIVNNNGTNVKIPYYAVWYMDTQELINIALGALLSVIGWFARQLWDAVQELKHDISGLELHVSENYARKDDVNAKFDRIEQLLDKIYDKLDAKADR